MTPSNKRSPRISAHLTTFRNRRLFEFEFDKNELEGSIRDEKQLL